MANANRLVMRFSVAPGGGLVSKNEWTETIWNLTDQSPNDLANKITGAGPDPIINAREKLLSKGWRLKSFTVYSNQGGRKRAFRSIERDGQFPGTLAEHDEQPYDKVLVTASTTNYTRPIWLGGVPFGVIGPGGNYQGFPPGVNKDAIQYHQFVTTDFLNALKANGWAMQHIGVSLPLTVTAVQLTNVAGHNGSNRTPVLEVQTGVGSPFGDVTNIRISGVTSPANLNGQWTAKLLSASLGISYIFLLAKRKLSISGEYTSGGVVRILTPSYEPFVALAPVRGTSRKVGDGPKSSRGRRSSRRT